MLAHVMEEPPVLRYILRSSVGILHLHGVLAFNLPVLFGKGQGTGVGSENVSPERQADGHNHGQGTPLAEPSGEPGLKLRQQPIPDQKRCIERGGIKQRRHLQLLFQQRVEGHGQEIERRSQLEEGDDPGENCHHRYGEVRREKAIEQRGEAEQCTGGGEERCDAPLHIADSILQQHHKENDAVATKALHGVPGMDRKRYEPVEQLQYGG